MKTITLTKQEKNYASMIHLSLLTKYFIPFGNYILPVVLWGSKKNESEFVDHNGKQALNFQLSMLLYTVTLLIVTVPTILFTLFNNVSMAQIERGEFVLENLPVHNISGFAIVALIAGGLFCLSKIAEFFFIIYMAVKSNNGEEVKYPFTINFIK